MAASPRLNGDPALLRAANNLRPLRTGDSGRGIRIFQQALIDLGFDMPRSMGTGSPDGIFGSETEATVKAFQQQNGLTVDGIAGAETLARLDQILSVTELERQITDQTVTIAPFPVGSLFIT